MVIVDTTVLVHAFGRPSEWKDPSLAVLGAAASGQADVRTTVEVMQEFVHVRARRHGRAEAVQQARNLSVTLAPLLSTDSEDLELGMQIYSKTARVGAFDAVLAAAAINRQAEALVSADYAFAEIESLMHLTPTVFAARLAAAQKHP